MDRKLKIIGCAGTLMYAGVIATMTWYRMPSLWDFDTDINAVGDFLAGAFAPLAFLWLVIGYFQQSKSLKLQIDELTNSVQQQAELATTNKSQLALSEQNAKFEKQKLEASVEPRFSMASGGASTRQPSGFSYSLRLYNGGHGVTCVSLFQEEKQIRYWHGVACGDHVDVKVDFDGVSDGHICFIKVFYLNGLSVERQVTFQLQFKYENTQIPNLEIVKPSGKLKEL